MGDDITIGVTEIVNNIEVTAQPNDQIVDISVTDNADNVTLNITPTVIEINVNKGGSFAKWGDIYGTLSDQTDLQTALGLKQNTITLTTTGTTGAATLVGSTLNIPNYTTDISGLVPYTGATTNVDLGTHKLTASDLVINHASGSGVAASITKGGSGEALTVVKSSGSGNAASITGGTTLLSELHLTTDLADDYIASAATWNAKQSALNGTGFVKISGTTISYDNSTYALDSAVVKLAGAQIITGLKTFSNMPILSAASGVNGQIVYADASNQLKTITNFKYNDATGVLTTQLGDLGSNAYTSTAYQPLLTNPVTASTSTANYLSKFTGSGYAIGNSLIYDNGTNVGIGTTSPGAKLSVNGTLQITGSGAPSSGTGLELFYDGTGAGTLAFSRGVGYIPNYMDGSQLQFFTGSSERMRITSGGNVGIGTTSPTEKLSVAGGNISLGAGYKLQYSSTAYMTPENNVSGAEIATGGILTIKTGGTTERVRVDSSGNVGIGTTSPSAKLHISGNANSPFLYSDGAGTGYSFADIRNTGARLAFGVENSTGSTSFTGALAYSSWIGSLQSSTAFQIVAGNSLSTTFLANGNVGIGTPSPLSVGGGWRSLNIDGTKAGLVLSNSGLNPSYIYTNGTGGVDLVIENSGSQIFNAGSTERMRITSGGNVGIGTSSPTFPFGSGLHIQNSTAAYLKLSYTGNVGFDLFQSGLDSYIFNRDNGVLLFGTNNAERMRITSGGNVLIGTTTDAGHKLQISSGGDSGISITSTSGAYTGYINLGSAGGGAAVIRSTGASNSMLFEVGGASRLTITSSGAATFSSTVTATGFFNSSDNRLKDLIDYDYNVSDIKPITYLWKDGRDDKKHVGYSAQEVQKVMPDAVNEGTDGMLSVNYVEVLVAQVELLNNRMAEMQKEIELLKYR